MVAQLPIVFVWFCPLLTIYLKDNIIHCRLYGNLLHIDLAKCAYGTRSSTAATLTTAIEHVDNYIALM